MHYEIETKSTYLIKHFQNSRLHIYYIYGNLLPKKFVIGHHIFALLRKDAGGWGPVYKMI